MLHIIHKQKITLNLREVGEAWKLQDCLSNLYKGNFDRDLESVFDKASSEKEVVRIEKLELNLGEIPYHDFENYFKERLLAELSKTLREVHHNHHTDNVKVVKQNQSVLDSFIFFLEYGYLPWYTEFKSIETWEETLKTSLTSTDLDHLLKWLEKEIVNSSYIIDRLVLQFSDNFLAFILTVKKAEEINFSIPVFNDLVSLIAIVTGENKNSIRVNIWKYALIHSIKEDKGEDVIVSTLYSFLSISNLPRMLDGKMKDWKKLFHKTLSLNISEDLVFDIIVSLLSSIRLGRITAVPDAEALVKQIESKKKSTFSINSEIVKVSFLKLIIEFVEGENVVETAATNVGSTQIPDSSPPPDAEQQKDNNNETKYKKKDNILEETGLIASNCGIVILHPFLKAYFAGLELYANDQFTSIENQQRACLLLHYLATGKSEVAEVDLIFQKFLCGIELSEPVPNKIELSDKEIEESAGLLNAVIGYWPPLSRTSIEGLQSTFLQRQGKLSKTDNGWRLFIENKTLDILLDKLPWGYSMIKLPWIKEILNVDWR